MFYNLHEDITFFFPDYNGMTPHAPEVIEAMRIFLETELGNPSSTRKIPSGNSRSVHRW